MAGWFTGSAEDAAVVKHVWPDCDIIPEPVRTLYLAAAKAACLAYAPTLADPAVVPEEYRLAQGMQARNLYNAASAGPGGNNDGSGYGLTSFPLDWQVKQLLRPEQGIGVVV